MPPQGTYRLNPLGADLTVHLSGLLGRTATRPDLEAARRGGATSVRRLSPPR